MSATGGLASSFWLPLSLTPDGACEMARLRAQAGEGRGEVSFFERATSLNGVPPLSLSQHQTRRLDAGLRRRNLAESLLA